MHAEVVYILFIMLQNVLALSSSGLRFLTLEPIICLFKCIIWCMYVHVYKALFELFSRIEEGFFLKIKINKNKKDFLKIISTWALRIIQTGHVSIHLYTKKFCKLGTSISVLKRFSIFYFIWTIIWSLTNQVYFGGLVSIFFTEIIQIVRHHLLFLPNFALSSKIFHITKENFFLRPVSCPW